MRNTNSANGAPPVDLGDGVEQRAPQQVGALVGGQLVGHADLRLPGGQPERPPQCGIESCLDGSGCLDSVPIVVQGDEARGAQAGPRSPEVIAAELDLLREELRRALRLPAREAQVRVADELPADKRADLLRGALLDAVAEIDRGRPDG